MSPHWNAISINIIGPCRFFHPTLYWLSSSLLFIRFLLNWLYTSLYERTNGHDTFFSDRPSDRPSTFCFSASAIKGFITFGNYYFPLVVVRWMQIALSRVLCIVSLCTVVYSPVSFLRHINANNDAQPIRNYPDKRNSVRWIKFATATMSPSPSPFLPFCNSHT